MRESIPDCSTPASEGCCEREDCVFVGALDDGACDRACVDVDLDGTPTPLDCRSFDEAHYRAARDCFGYIDKTSPEPIAGCWFEAAIHPFVP